MKFPKLEPRNVQLWFKNHRAKVKRVRLEICRQRQQEMTDATAAAVASAAAVAAGGGVTSSASYSAAAAAAAASLVTSPQQQQHQQQQQQQQQHRRSVEAAFGGALRLGVQSVAGGIFTSVPGSNPFSSLSSR